MSIRAAPAAARPSCCLSVQPFAAQFRFDLPAEEHVEEGADHGHHGELDQVLLGRTGGGGDDVIGKLDALGLNRGSTGNLSLRCARDGVDGMLITPTGIGDIISYSQSVADYDKMYAAIFAIIVSSVLFIELLEKIEQVMFKPEKRT
jgi:hypothetical protein